MSVPLIDTKRDAHAHREEYLSAAARVIDSGSFSLGPEVEAFEKEFAAFLGVKHVVGVNGGTEALYASFLALGIGPGDEVILPTNSFIATAEAVMMAGAKPVFCDVDQATHLLDLGTCRRLVTKKTKAIVPVHLYGLACDMDAVLAFATSRHLHVVEDAAQAHGAFWNGKRVGSMGVTGCFSFYPTKNLGAIGEGGAVSTNDDSIAEKLRAIRLHGIMKDKSRHEIFGTNLKMEALQAAFLRLRLGRLDAANARRREIAGKYRTGFAGLPVSFPGDFGDRHVYHWFVLDTNHREALMKHLSERGIGCGIHYPITIHMQPSMSVWGGKKGQCPEAEAVTSRIVSLPIFSDLTDDEVSQVISAIRDFFADKPRIKASVMILTLNSRAVLERMLPRLIPHFEDVFIMDGNSTDGTQDFTRSFGVRVEKQFDHDIPNSRIEDFMEMRYRLWSKAKQDWLFLVDADEYPSPELIDFVRKTVAEDKRGEAHRVRRIAKLPDGRLVDHASFYPDYYIRLFRKSEGLTLAKRKIHERFVLPAHVKQIDHDVVLIAPWVEPEALERKTDNYISLELDTEIKSAAQFWRWIVWYNVWHGAGQFLRVLYGYARSAIDGSVALPWAYERVFFLYKWKMIKGYWSKLRQVKV
ncbi:aminotransferase class I/II-fold pyridoxal phosphate-dependent enzyme [Candidatus Uhrbacteria bacterium]|nr:aminotransferase class I/II-fold pyridoxal phosphate-dependent enzyme [Candidatus Uhrbacteria bacterium]